MWKKRGRSVLAALPLLLTACEGYNRNDAPPTDLKKTPEQTARDARAVRVADELERMNELRRGYIDQLAAMEHGSDGSLARTTQARTDYLGQLHRLEKVYLERGDMARSNWARNQRKETEAATSPRPVPGKPAEMPSWSQQRKRVEEITVYPYGSDQPPEYAADVQPIRSEAGADRLYADAEKLVMSFRMVPLAGALDVNKDKARQAIRFLRELLVKHPQSDKVDDAAFWIGECYKEYLREEDTDNKLALLYYRWALELDPQTPHPARFQSAVVYDFRLHDRKSALAMYHRVLKEQEAGHYTNARFAAERIRQLTDDDRSKERPIEEPEPTRVAGSGEEPMAEPAPESNP